MELILLRSSDVNNDPSLITAMFEFIIELMADVVKVMQTIYIFKQGSVKVSLFDFLIALAVMSIVITYLVNVARRPNITSSSAEVARERAKDKAYRERTIIEELRMRK